MIRGHERLIREYEEAETEHEAEIEPDVAVLLTGTSWIEDLLDVTHGRNTTCAWDLDDGVSVALTLRDVVDECIRIRI